METQALDIKELVQTKPANEIRIATLESDVGHSSRDQARLEKEKDKFEGKLETAQSENRMLLESNANLRYGQAIAVANVQAKLDKALEDSQILEQDLNDSRDTTRDLATEYNEFKGSVKTALTDLGMSVENLPAAWIITTLTSELLKVLRDLLVLDSSTVVFHPRLTHRLTTVYDWMEDSIALPRLDLQWYLITRTTSLPGSFGHIISRLRLSLLSELPVSLEAVEALFQRSEQCPTDDKKRLVEMSEVLWSDGAGLIDELHAFATARMVEFLIRGSSDLGEGAAHIFRLCQTWRTTYQVRRLLLVAYSRWFESLEGTPLTMPHIIRLLQQDVTIMREPDTSRVLYCNILTGYHLLADDNTLVLFEESSLKLSMHQKLISFPDDQILAFATNPSSERLNPMIRRHMPGL
jgi:hypothetical protein